MIFDGMLRNSDNVFGQFLMYQRFIQTFLDKQLDGLPTHTEKYDVSFHTKKVFANMKRIGKGFFGKEKPLVPTMVGPGQVQMGEGGVDSLVRATTTASSLEAEHDSGNVAKTQTKATSNDPISKGTSSSDGSRCQDIIWDTYAHAKCERVSKMSNDELKRTNTAQQTKIDGLETRFKKLKKKHRSRTHKLKRLYKVGLTARVISSSDDEALDKEDTSKHERIDEIDVAKDITRVSTYNDVVQDEGIEDVGEEEVVEVFTTTKMIVDAAQVTTAIANIPVGVAETNVTTALTITTESTKTYVEVKLIEEPEMPKKRQHQIRADKELAVKLQAEIDEEDRLVTEKSQQVEEVNLVWDDVYTKIKADYEMAQRLKAKEQEQLTDAEKAKLFMKFLEKGRKFFPRALKNKSFAENQELFDKTMKRINNFVDFRTELVDESTKKDKVEIAQESYSKREGDELEQKSSKKQKVSDDKESEELKKCLKIIPDDVTIDATPLFVKNPIIYYKIYKEGKKNYFQIFRADGNSQMYLTFVDHMDSFLMYNLKTMFEHHVKDNAWKNQQGLAKVKN
uniref:Uncharacterized protein n=1 Tax=Tanacetum cinerariifolium TaxID=118510 RepID=A0A699GYS7_TANCI|nr:hypothetical protein [Tanacetum cinerariifolium]